jgi:peptide/nickel transport system substrate-binding protein
LQTTDANLHREVVYLDRFDNYYAGKASLARFQLHAYESRDAIIKALNQNEVNAAADLLPADTNNIDKNRYTVMTKTINSGVYALMNTKSPLLKDDNVRLALRLATDVGSIIEKLPDSTKPLSLPFIEGQVQGKFVVSGFDIEKAKNTLNKAGWTINKDGVRAKNGVELKISVVTMRDSEFEIVLETLVGQWRSIGVVVDTKVVDPKDITQNVAQSILQPRSFDVLLYRLNIGADPDVFAYWHSSQASNQGSNFSNYSSIISDDALSSARSRLETDLRNAKYVTFVKQWINDVPAIGLYQSTIQYVFNNKIRSIDDETLFISPLDRYSDVLNWSVGSRGVYRTP